mmetsp:Transcript_23975/g.36277  ORF Transcript_23975/g.36277 Transcript_23975/m.36277 type:complete len:493 (+) Transcript_23975:106-1584(+)
MLNQRKVKTTEWQTFVHLIKGNVGPGCLSLPWAISQLGVVVGVLSIVCLSLWTSYNCWVIVLLKRHIEGQATQSGENPYEVTNITYPELGNWAYGKRFRNFISSCICTLQLAICTVFMSFIGENLNVALARWFHPISHTWVILLSLPGILVLVCGFPSLKSLAPVTVAATASLFLGFGLLAVIICQEWKDRPDQAPRIHLPSLSLALCAILYSFEGICLVIPLESAMIRPANFGRVFGASMICVTFTFCLVSSICVITFGEVTNGSITAFLLQKQQDLEDGALFWILLSNIVVSISVMLTYPLQLFPCLELMGPCISRKILYRHQDATTELLSQDINYSDQVENHSTNYNAMNDDGETLSARLEHHSNTNTSPFWSTDSSGILGDSLTLRLILTLFTFLVAVIVPNVQVLISLAGALAGASVSLLIPPMLELAYISRKEVSQENCSYGVMFSSWLRPRVRCYLSIAFGVVFLLIGTISSLMDILEVYKTPSR